MLLVLSCGWGWRLKDTLFMFCYGVGRLWHVSSGTFCFCASLGMTIVLLIMIKVSSSDTFSASTHSAFHMLPVALRGRDKSFGRDYFHRRPKLSQIICPPRAVWYPNTILSCSPLALRRQFILDRLLPAPPKAVSVRLSPKSLKTVVSFSSLFSRAHLANSTYLEVTSLTTSQHTSRHTQSKRSHQ